MTTVRITDAGGNKPTFVQWDVDRVLYVSGVASKPYLHFSNAALKRAIVVQATDDNGRWKCLVPNFILQYACQMVVSVFVQPDEGKTVATLSYGVQPRMKPQDYSYEENIGYINWVQKSQEVQELLDSCQESLDSIDAKLEEIQNDYDSGAFKGDKGDAGTAGPQGPAGATGAPGADGRNGAPGADGADGEDGYSPTVTVTEITGGRRVTITDVNGGHAFDVMDGEAGGSATVDSTLSSSSENPVQNKVIAAALGNKADKVTEVTVSAAGSVTQALDAGKIYHFTGALTALTITLNAAASGQLAQYHFDFSCGATAPTVTIPNTVKLPSGSFEAGKHYEVDILNNYGAVISWASS